jgi:hypothetical protein
MTKQVQRRRGTATQHTSFTGAEGEISVNTTNKSVHVHDGTTAGGIEAARADLGNVSDADLNTALSGNTLASLTVTSADINSGTIDGTVIGGTTAAAGSFTTLSASTSISGTLSTAAQPNVTSVGNLTSLNVTGTITSDGLTVDGNGAFSGADTYLAFIETDLTDESTRLRQTSGSLYIQKANNSGGFIQNMAQFSTNGDISFYEDTGTTPKFFWDASAESLGLGTSSPSNQIHLHTTSTSNVIQLTNSATGTGAGDGMQIVTSSLEMQLRNREAGPTTFYTSNAERMRITSDGSVGIGTSSPQSNLHMRNPADAASVLAVDHVSGGNGYGGYISSIGSGANQGLILGRKFNSTLTEAMRIDSSGNLLVGQSSSTQPGVGNTTNGFAIRNDGLFFSSAYQGRTGTFGRNGNDGPILGFYRDGSTVGSIVSRVGVVSSIILDPRTGGAGLTGGGPGAIIPTGNTGSSNDGVVDLGADDGRWKDLYLSGGVYLGGTGSANKLDDYEEGTWTPGWIGSGTNPTITYGSRWGRYTKIGDMVHCVGYINHTSVSGGSGYAFIVDLPFTSSSMGEQAFGQVGLTTAFDSGYTPIAIHVSDNNTYCWVYYQSTVGGSISSTPSVGNLASSGTIYFSVHYKIA